MSDDKYWDGFDPVSRRVFLGTGAKAAGVTIGAGALASFLAACGSSDSGSSSTGGGSATGSATAAGSAIDAPTADAIAKASGTLNVLGSQTYESHENDPAGLTVKWAYNTTNEQILTKTTQPGTFDVVVIYQGEIDQLRKLDRIVPIDPDKIPNYATLSSFFTDTDVTHRDGQLYAVPYHWGYGYCEYNKDHVAPPTKYSDLLAPALKKKVGLPDDPYAVITNWAIFAGMPKPNNLDKEQFDAVMKLLTEFKSQVLTIHQYGEEAQLFGRGDIWVGLPEYSSSVIESAKAGANMDITTLGAFSYVDCFMILKDAKNPAGAYAYINQALTPEAQLASTKKSQAFPVLDSAITALPKALQYKSAADVLKVAPLLPGVTVETGGPDVPFQDWVKAWEKFKAA
jgi:putative spermidine/putrescine transport system substrate-binding protein